MSKVNYKFNTRSLTYEKVEVTFKQRFMKFLSYVATGTVFATITITIAFTYFDSPKEKIQKREIENLRFQYDLLQRRMDQVGSILQEMQERDDNIYRVVFEAEPIPDNIRKAGFGGGDRYKELSNYENSDLIISTAEKLDKITKQLYIQSKSFDELMKMAKNKEKLLACIPAIQPVSNKKLKYFSMGARN